MSKVNGTDVGGSAIVLPSNVAVIRGRQNAMLLAGEWKVVWRNEEPRRIAFIHHLLPKPHWAEHEWQPPHDAFTEDVACRAVLRTFVAEGWEAQEVDDEMGQSIRGWASNPQRTMSKPQGGKNDLIRCYEATRAHLLDGGRLRDVPVNVVQMVAENMGLSRWRHWLQAEVEQYGPFEGEYKELVEDCWRESGDDDMKRLDEGQHLQRKDEVK